MLRADASKLDAREAQCMDMLTALPLPIALAILALVDGLSVGTLLIPLFLIIAPGRPPTRRIIGYLTTITAFYFVVGVLFTLGIVSIIDVGRAVLDSGAGQTALLLVGLALLGSGLWLGAADSKRRKAADGAPPESGRLLRWRARLLDSGTSGAAVAAVAIAAGLAEIAGMFPYLIGMTMLADAPIGALGRGTLLAGYCIVMILPALLLLLARIVAARAVEAPLQRFTAWLQRTGPENTAWLLGIIGFLLARMAATNLGLNLPVIG